ncbi:hypothetical protein GCM10029976_056880 [Kribbella albertanoniae]
MGSSDIWSGVRGPQLVYAVRLVGWLLRGLGSSARRFRVVGLPSRVRTAVYSTPNEPALPRTTRDGSATRLVTTGSNHNPSGSNHNPSAPGLVDLCPPTSTSARRPRHPAEPGIPPSRTQR